MQSAFTDTQKTALCWSLSALRRREHGAIDRHFRHAFYTPSTRKNLPGQ